MNTIYSTGELARILGIPPYRISYAHSSGQLPEPAFRFLGKRCYTTEDLAGVAKHFGKSIGNVPAATEDAE